jgi:predicted ATPase
MKITVNKDYRTFKKGDVFDFTRLDSFKFITIVGNNGSGKSTLIQTIRGFKHSLKEESLFADDYKKLAHNVTIEANYSNIFVLDSIKDDSNHFMNAYDASNYVSMGGMNIKDKSHGESSLINIHVFFEKIKNKIVKNETLVILDEADKGLSLKAQTIYLNFVFKLITAGCHVIVITHNIFAIKDSLVVYNLEKKDWQTSKSYIKELTGFTLEDAKE